MLGVRAAVAVLLTAVIVSACGSTGPVRERHNPKDFPAEGIFTGKDGGIIIRSDKEKAAAGGETLPPASAEEYQEFQDFREYRQWKEKTQGTPEYREFQDWREWKTYRAWKERAK